MLYVNYVYSPLCRTRIRSFPVPMLSGSTGACNLPEESYSTVFEELRQNFPALEAFAVEMEESYWAPGEGRGDSGSNAGSSRTPEPAPALRVILGYHRACLSSPITASRLTTFAFRRM